MDTQPVYHIQKEPQVMALQAEGFQLQKNKPGAHAPWRFAWKWVLFEEKFHEISCFYRPALD